VGWLWIWPVLVLVGLAILAYVVVQLTRGRLGPAEWVSRDGVLAVRLADRDNRRVGMQRHVTGADPAGAARGRRVRLENQLDQNLHTHGMHVSLKATRTTRSWSVSGAG